MPSMGVGVLQVSPPPPALTAWGVMLVLVLVVVGVGVEVGWVRRTLPLRRVECHLPLLLLLLLHHSHLLKVMPL